VLRHYTVEGDKRWQAMGFLRRQGPLDGPQRGRRAPRGRRAG
jgi:hypothetical protein